MRLLLALLLQQLQHIAGLGNLREIELRLDFRSGRFVSGGAGLGGKIFPDPVRFIFFYGA
jgi:hypothetical protein